MEHITKKPRWQELKDKLAEADYRRTMGLDCVDTGSNLAKKREIVKRLKAKGIRTAKIWKLPSKNLHAVMMKIY